MYRATQTHVRVARQTRSSLRLKIQMMAGFDKLNEEYRKLNKKIILSSGKRSEVFAWSMFQS